jgi:hypothetical protein
MRTPVWSDASISSCRRIPAFDLKQVPFAYPTYGSDIRFMI